MDGRKYIGSQGRVLGMNTFGESVPASKLFESFGVTSENILDAIDEMISTH